jgi:hypothetical protein
MIMGMTFSADMARKLSIESKAKREEELNKQLCDWWKKCALIIEKDIKNVAIHSNKRQVVYTCLDEESLARYLASDFVDDYRAIAEEELKKMGYKTCFYPGKGYLSGSFVIKW